MAPKKKESNQLGSTQTIFGRKNFGQQIFSDSARWPIEELAASNNRSSAWNPYKYCPNGRSKIENVFLLHHGIKNTVMERTLNCILFVSLKFLFNQQFWKKRLFTDYCEFRKIRTIINLTRDISKTKRANDFKIWTYLHHIQAKPIESLKMFKCWFVQFKLIINSAVSKLWLKIFHMRGSFAQLKSQKTFSGGVVDKTMK